MFKFSLTRNCRENFVHQCPSTIFLLERIGCSHSNFQRFEKSKMLPPSYHLVLWMFPFKFHWKISEVSPATSHASKGLRESRKFRAPPGHASQLLGSCSRGPRTLCRNGDTTRISDFYWGSSGSISANSERRSLDTGNLMGILLGIFGNLQKAPRNFWSFQMTKKYSIQPTCGSRPSWPPSRLRLLQISSMVAFTCEEGRGRAMETRDGDGRKSGDPPVNLT